MDSISKMVVVLGGFNARLGACIDEMALAEKRLVYVCDELGFQQQDAKDGETDFGLINILESEESELIFDLHYLDSWSRFIYSQICELEEAIQLMSKRTPHNVSWGRNPKTPRTDKWTFGAQAERMYKENRARKKQRLAEAEMVAEANEELDRIFRPWVFPEYYEYLDPYWEQPDLDDDDESLGGTFDEDDDGHMVSEAKLQETERETERFDEDLCADMGIFEDYDPGEPDDRCDLPLESVAVGI